MLDQVNPSYIPAVDTDLPIGRWLVDAKASKVAFHVEHFWGLVAVSGEFNAMDAADIHPDITFVPTAVQSIDHELLRVGLSPDESASGPHCQ